MTQRSAAARQPAQVPPGPRPSVVIELPNRASLPARIAHPIAKATLRTGLNMLTFVGDKGPIKDPRVFKVSNYFDPAAKVLVAVPGTRRRPVRFDKFRAEWVWHRDTADPAQVRDSAILYMHGGGFVACGLNSHRRIVSRIARASGMPLLNVAYRQLPAAHITETIDDCVEAYHYLLNQGFPAHRIILAGDSAGGGLTFRLAVEARERGLPMPGGITAISPWADLESVHKRAHRNFPLDPMIHAGALEIVTKWGFQRNGTIDPAWSAVNHSFEGLPPALIQVGSTEVLLSDCERLAQRYAEAGIRCRLQVWDRQIHVWHAGADLLPEGRAAIREIGAFNQRILNGTVRPYRTRLRRALDRRRAADRTGAA